MIEKGSTCVRVDKEVNFFTLVLAQYAARQSMSSYVKIAKIGNTTTEDGKAALYSRQKSDGSQWNDSTACMKWEKFGESQE